ncbi:alpha/beta fold hydrolase [Methanoregula sp.]|uniref:alpha/beta fold hydrolase n=1 Tax=Methanoregula sp. TaxID=2052170 RepID=UPI00356131BA
MPLQKVNDIDMYYEIHGEGEPIILIAGIWSDLSGWKTTIPALSKKYKVLALDTRGAGRTDKPDIPYTIEMMADDTVGLMDALGISRAHILGASMGSRIAQAIAIKYPARVTSLVLHVAAARQSLSILKGLLVLSTRFRMRDPHFFDKISAYPPTSASALRQFDAHMAFDSREWLGKIRAPTIIINGTKDAIVGPGKYTDELVSGIPGAKLVMVEGTHFFASEDPFLLINPAVAFMAEVDGRQTG